MPTLQLETSAKQTARSADDIRAWIVTELSKSMNVAPTSIDTAAPLDSLGVDSLAAIGMTGALAGWLNRDLPTTLMWEYSSIDAIANGLADPNAPRKLSPQPGVFYLQPNGSRTPLFFYPGLRGYAVTFAPLATQLGTEQPCFVVNIPGFETGEQSLASVEEIAAAMVNNMRRVQPSGPYQMAGYSFGGLVAYEAARQLAAAGDTVSLLAIYDTFTPGGRIFRPRWQRAFIHGYLLLARPGRWKYIHDRWKRLTKAHDAKTGEATRDVGDDPWETRAKAVVSVNFRAAMKYRPLPYSGTMHLFRATKKANDDVFYHMKKDNGWGPLVGKGLHIIDLPGSHLTFLRAEYAAIAAEKLKPFLG